MRIWCHRGGGLSTTIPTGLVRGLRWQAPGHLCAPVVLGSFGNRWFGIFWNLPKLKLKPAGSGSVYIYKYLCILIGGLEHEVYFSIQLGIITPTDFHIFQRGRSTTNQMLWLIASPSRFDTPRRNLVHLRYLREHRHRFISHDSQRCSTGREVMRIELPGVSFSIIIYSHVQAKT